jgi:hypothetical protein
MFGNNYGYMPQTMQPLQNPYLASMPTNMQSAQLQPCELVRVTGIDGAKAYPMQANSAVALFDNNEDVMYIKTTDGAGFPTVKAYAFTAVEERQTLPITEYVSRDEFEKLKAEVKGYAEQFISANDNKRNTKSKSAE